MPTTFSLHDSIGSKPLSDDDHPLLQPLMIGGLTIENRLIVAPMAGVTDNAPLSVPLKIAFIFRGNSSICLSVSRMGNFSF